MAITNNDTLRRLRYIIDASDVELLNIMQAGGCTIKYEELSGYLKKDTDSGFVPCSDEVLAATLDGLILRYRGPKDKNTKPQALHEEFRLSNNDILKKLRIAFELKEDDVLKIMERAGAKVSVSELGALFRQKDHRNYKPCGDQFLRNFLTGLESYKDFKIRA